MTAPRLPVAALALLLAALPSRAATAQAAPPARLAASIRRLFGAGARVDTLRVDSAAVLRLSRGDSLLGFTISVQAVTAGVRRILADLTAWHGRGAIR